MWKYNMGNCPKGKCYIKNIKGDNKRLLETILHEQYIKHSQITGVIQYKMTAKWKKLS